jgi:hypothetical protein
MTELERTGLGEINAVACAQAPGLALEIRAIEREISILVDETIPDVDVCDARLFSVAAVKIIEIRYVGSRLPSTDCRQPNPENRHTPAFQRRDGVVDALAVEPTPLV